MTHFWFWDYHKRDWIKWPEHALRFPGALTRRDYFKSLGLCTAVEKVR